MKENHTKPSFYVFYFVHLYIVHPESSRIYKVQRSRGKIKVTSFEVNMYMYMYT